MRGKSVHGSNSMSAVVLTFVEEEELTVGQDLNSALSAGLDGREVDG